MIRQGAESCGIVVGMQAPLFVRPPTDAERQALAAGLRAADAFTLRRSQIVLASARGERVPVIARATGTRGAPASHSWPRRAAGRPACPRWLLDWVSG